MRDSNDLDHDDDGLTSLVRLVVPDFVRKRFTLKFALILAVMGITIGFIGATGTGMVSAQVEDNVEQEYKNLAAQKANVIEKWVQRNSISVKLASKNDALASRGDGAAYNMRNELATTGGNLYGVQAIYLVNRTATESFVVASPQMPFDTRIGNTGRRWLNNVSVGQLGVAEVRITKTHMVDGTPVIAFISPVQGAPNRYLVIEYDVQALADSLEQGSRSSRFTQVVDGNGTIRVASDSSEILQRYGGTRAMEPVRRASALSGASSGVLARAGPNPAVLDTEYTVGYAPVEVANSDLNWTVLVHEPTSNVFGFVTAISTWGKLATLGGMLLIGLLGAAIGYSTTRDINRLRLRAEQMREGNLDVSVSTGRIDSIGQLYEGFDDMRQSLKAQIQEAEQARKEAEVSRAEAMEMNRYLEQKAEEYSEIMRRCAGGDLTQRMNPDGENEAMDQIAEEFNHMIAELERTTGQLKSFAAEVEHVGETLQSSSDSVRVASEHVADSVQTISDDAYDQKERLESISTEIDDLVDFLDEYAADHEDMDFETPLDQFTEIASTVSEVAETSEQTLAETEIVAGAAEEQAAELNQVSQRAEDLTRYASPLQEVLDGFETDADQELYFPDQDVSADPPGSGTDTGAGSGE